MKAPVFTGSGVAIVTPMLPDRTINFEKLDELIEFQLQNGTDSIVICGTTGETPTLTEQEHLEAISHAVKTVGGRCPSSPARAATPPRTASTCPKRPSSPARTPCSW